MELPQDFSFPCCFSFGHIFDSDGIHLAGWITCPNDLQERLERRDTAAVEDSALGRCASVKGWWEEGVVGFLCRIGRFYAFLR